MLTFKKNVIVSRPKQIAVQSLASHRYRPEIMTVLVGHVGNHVTLVILARSKFGLCFTGQISHCLYFFRRASRLHEHKYALLLTPYPQSISLIPSITDTRSCPLSPLISRPPSFPHRNGG